MNRLASVVVSLLVPTVILIASFCILSIFGKFFMPLL